MGFLDASALGLLALIPLVVLLYFMKLRRRDRVVSANFLWARALEQSRSDSFLEKLKVNLLLFLQIAGIIFASLALARPFVHVAGMLAPELVIVIDTSAGAQAVDGGLPRLDGMRRQALKLVDEARPGTSIMLVGAARHPDVICSFSRDKQTLRRALSGLQATDEPLDLRPVLMLTASLAASHPSAGIYLFTTRSIPDASLLTPACHVVPCGGPVSNVAITAFEVRQNTAFVQVDQYGSPPVHGYLEMRLGDTLLDSRELTGTSRGFIFQIPEMRASDVLHAHLDVQDALACDNDAWTVLPAARPKRVLVVTSGNPFLEKALALLPETEVYRIVPAEYRTSQGYDVTVWDGTRPAAIDGPAVVFGAGSGRLAGPFDIQWQHDHPIFAHVDLTAVHVAETRRLDARGQVLASVPGTPLMTLDGHVLRIGFDIFHSDWPLSVSFPIFMANCMQFLEEGSVEHLPGQVRVGAPLMVEGHVFDTSRVGLYTVSDRHVGVNLLDPTTSDLPPPHAAPAASPGGTGSGAAPATRELADLFLALFLALILIEWWYYHRRTA
ncbi:MAG: vWA domain-containing protein [Candidatus Xenobia bacterium]